MSFDNHGFSGYNPYPGSAAPSTSIEPLQPLPYNVGLPIQPEQRQIVQERQAIFTPSMLMINGSYDNAEIMPDTHHVTWDYASPFLYARPHAAPYPYVLIDR